ncbi:MAG: hypothetical protein ACFE7R_06970 [Candidatus Hodarchaeota archaeon]
MDLVDSLSGGPVTTRLWKLTTSDGTVHEFRDIRRKVGHQIIRAYLLEDALKKNRVEKLDASLRGPKNEFKNFDNFLILRAKGEGSEFRILVEANVYDNLRIVGTDSENIAEKTPDEIVETFTVVLENLDTHSATLIISKNSDVKTR